MYITVISLYDTLIIDFCRNNDYFLSIPLFKVCELKVPCGDAEEPAQGLLMAVADVAEGSE